MTGLATGAGGLVGAAFGWWGGLATLLFVVAFALAGGRRQHVASSALVVAAALLGAWRVESLPEASSASVEVPTFETATVVSNPVRQNRVQRFVARPEPIGEAELGNPALICVTGDVVPVVQLGDSLRLSGRVRRTSDAPAGIRAAYGARSCAGSVFADSMSIVASRASPERLLAEVRTRFGHALRLAAPGDAGVLLTGLVTGDDAGFSRARDAAFIRTGTTHLTAVSGANLALVAGFLATIGVATLGRHRGSWQALTIAGVWSYALICGTQAPAIRAAIVATAAIIAFRFGRQPDFPTLILLAAAVMAVVDPGQVDALGFRLSVASSLALAIVLPAMMNRDRMSGAAAVIAATAAAQIATLPLLLPVFGSISLVSLPANVLVAPLVLVSMPLAAGAAIVGLASPQIAGAIAAPATITASATLAVVDRLGAPDALIHAGMPPIGSAVAIAATCALLLLALSRDLDAVIGQVNERLHGERSRADSSSVHAGPVVVPRLHRETEAGVEGSAGIGAGLTSAAAADPRSERSSGPLSSSRE